MAAQIRSPVRALAAIACASAWLGCASSGQPAPARAPEPGAKPERAELQMKGELGVLDEKRVTVTFEELKDGLSRCLDRGHKLAAGNVTYAMRIGQDGKAKWAFLKDSTLGDRLVEKCMLELLRGASWPTPQGGEDGLAEKPFEFPDRDERPPVEWTPDRVASALGSARAKLAACGARAGAAFQVTAIVETNGRVGAAGISPPDEHGEQVADCLVGVVRGLKLPSPGSWPAKVSFQVP
jgi:hypothetical protein